VTALERELAELFRGFLATALRTNLRVRSSTSDLVWEALFSPEGAAQPM